MAVPRAKVETAEGNRQSGSSCAPSQLSSQGPPVHHAAHYALPEGRFQRVKTARPVALSGVSEKNIVRQSRGKWLGQAPVATVWVSLTAAQRDHVTPDPQGHLSPRHMPSLC